MADQSLRELLRRWQASGSPSDAAAWLGARLRAAELPEGRLFTAALLGSPGARRLLGKEAPRTERDLERWYAAAVEAEPELALRGAIAALRQVLPLFERRPERCERHGALRCEQATCRIDGRPRHALEGVERAELAGAPEPDLLARAEACLACQADLRAGRRALSPAREGLAEYGDAERKLPFPGAVLLAACASIARRGSDAQRVDALALLPDALPPALAFEGRRLPAAHPEWAARWGEAAPWLAREAFVQSLPLVRASAREEAAARGIDRDYALQEALEAVRVAVKAEVVPWLLGTADPLAERLARRPAPRVP